MSKWKKEDYEKLSNFIQSCVYCFSTKHKSWECPRKKEAIESEKEKK